MNALKRLDPAMTSTQRADVLYKMVAATGYIIGQMDELEHQGQYQIVFKQTFKQVAKRFYTECLNAEAAVTTARHDEPDASFDQLHDSYLLMNKVLDLTLLAGRKLTPEANLLMNTEMEELAAKYGLELD